MITVTPVIHIGNLVDGEFIELESYDMEIQNWSDPFMVDSLNEILNNVAVRTLKYAELRLHITGTPHDAGFLLGSFQKVKLKGKGYKWQLTL